MAHSGAACPRAQWPCFSRDGLLRLATLNGVDGSAEFQAGSVHCSSDCCAPKSETNRGSWTDRDFAFALDTRSVADNGVVVGRDSGDSVNWRREAQPM